ncbi:TonB-dependent receptor [Inquilinus sp. KBS0705]|nr:TonB-dependent receptor [Inquilinus sp. KBS0705]
MNNSSTSKKSTRNHSRGERSSFMLLVLFCLFLGFYPGKVSAQTNSKNVSGRVTDSKGQPLAGVSVSLKSTVNGTVTDVKGNFSLSVPTGSATLVFTYVGFATLEEQVSGRDRINVTLSENNSQLNEVVVVGYGTKQKASVTGAISQVDNKVFESRPLTNTLNALQGALPGLTVVRGSGKPGREAYDFQVRGFSSVNGNKPLVLIDGVASSNFTSLNGESNDLGGLNPNDIASVTVLKDASAAIYGARAADGVVLITTKKGLKGKPVINYTGNFGIKQADYLKKMTTTLQLAEMENEALTNVGLTGISDDVFAKIRANAEPDPNGGWLPYLQSYPGFYQTNDWNKILYGTATQQNHNLSISGGGENNNYLFSAGYARDNGIFKYGKDNSNRYNLRMNYDFKISDRIHIETRNSYENVITNDPSQLDGTPSSVARNVRWRWNFLPIFNPQGQYYTYQGYDNPIQELLEGGERTSNLNKFSFNAKADIKIIDGLTLTGQAGVNNSNYNDNAYYTTFNRYNYAGDVESIFNPLNSAYYTNNKNLYQSYSGYLQYDKALGKDHKIGLLVGTSFEKNRDYGTTVNGSNFTGNELFTLNLADQTNAAYTHLNGFDTDWALASYFSRLSYSFRNKFFLDATTRIDGSSKFSSDKRWSAVFPAISAAYNLSEENFIKKLGVIDNFKFRASWGKTGNQDISTFGNYDYIPLVNIGGQYPLGSPNAGAQGAISSISSPNRTWETIETTNLGLDLGFLRNRLTASIDIYRKENKNMLVNAQVPATLGGTPPSQNLGHLVTKGFDLSLGWRDQIGNFKYSITAIVSDSKNKLVELKGNDVLSQGLNYAHQGASLYSYYGYEATGIIQNAQQLENYKKLGNVPANLGVGDMMFKDIDGDGSLTPYGDPVKKSKGDLVNLGSLLPRYTYSSNINLAFKNFDLSVLIQGVGKQVVIRNGDFSIPLSHVWFQPLQYFYGKEWTPQNTNAKYPRLIGGGVGFDNLVNYNWQTSSLLVNNLAYLRFKVITLGYNLPESLTKKLKIAGARIYISGENLFTISKGTWDNSFDPEEGYSRQDDRTYPFTSVKSIGLNIKF